MFQIKDPRILLDLGFRGKVVHPTLVQPEHYWKSAGISSSGTTTKTSTLSKALKTCEASPGRPFDFIYGVVFTCNTYSSC